MKTWKVEYSIGYTDGTFERKETTELEARTILDALKIMESRIQRLIMAAPEVADVTVMKIEIKEES